MKARVYITLKEGVLDPQGQAVQRSLQALGFQGLQDVRMGKYLELVLADRSPESALQDLEKMCQNLLTNPVIEAYRLEIVDS